MNGNKKIYTTAWGFLSEKRKVPLEIDANGNGVIDANAEYAFSQGQCHALALAIQKQTGWKAYIAGQDWDAEMHVAVKTPDGRYLDIRGLHEGPSASWQATEIRELRPDEDWKAIGYLPPNVKAAEPFARTLLAEYVPAEREAIAA